MLCISPGIESTSATTYTIGAQVVLTCSSSFGSSAVSGTAPDSASWTAPSGGSQTIEKSAGIKWVQKITISSPVVANAGKYTCVYNYPNSKPLKSEITLYTRRKLLQRSPFIISCS